jgi:hypothetical protein
MDLGIEENETHSWGLHSCLLSWHQQGKVTFGRVNTDWLKYHSKWKILCLTQKPRDRPEEI